MHVLGWSRYRLVRRGLLSTAVSGIACVVLAAPVSAFVSRGTHVVPQPSSPNGEVFWSSTATCPVGQHVLFGGFQNGLSGMRRTADNRWTVYEFGFGGAGLPFPPPGPFTLSSFAYCGFGPVPSKATSTVVLRVGASRSATARCPAGTVVVAGGFASTPNTPVIVTGLERIAADLWRVTAFGFNGTTTALTSIAYCGPGPAPKLVSRTIKHYVSGPVRATCPAGRHLVFGGAIAKGNGYLTTLRARTQSTWNVGGLSNNGTLTALAYCR